MKTKISKIYFVSLCFMIFLLCIAYALYAARTAMDAYRIQFYTSYTYLGNNDYDRIFAVAIIVLAIIAVSLALFGYGVFKLISKGSSGVLWSSVVANFLPSLIYLIIGFVEIEAFLWILVPFVLMFVMTIIAYFITRKKDGNEEQGKVQLFCFSACFFALISIFITTDFLITIRGSVMLPILVTSFFALLFYCAIARGRAKHLFFQIIAIVFFVAWLLIAIFFSFPFATLHIVAPITFLIFAEVFAVLLFVRKSRKTVSVLSSFLFGQEKTHTQAMHTLNELLNEKLISDAEYIEQVKNLWGNENV